MLFVYSKLDDEVLKKIYKFVGKFMNDKIKISVVMTTYNGAKYIYQQLESILCQTLQPDEVLLFDDGSTDGTQKIIEHFISENNLCEKKWTLIQNKKNLGWRANFMQGFQKANGDFIFPCDQDDIWNKSKIEEMSNIMILHSEINVLCCNIEPFSDSGEKIYIAKFNLKSYGRKKIEKVSSFKFWMNPMRQGCTMCFRKNILGQLNSVWFDDCAHDLSLWSLGMATDSLYIYNKSLVKFRRHGGNNTPSNEKTQERKLSILTLYINLANSIVNNYSETTININKKKMREMIEFYEYRREMIESSNIFMIFKVLLNLKLYPQKKAIIGDIVSMYNHPDRL